MQVNSRGRFAIDAMISLALCDRTSPVALRQISRQLSVSLSYAEQIFKKLREKGIVNSMRGGNGGYTFARPLEEVTVADILLAVDAIGGAENSYALAVRANNEASLTVDLWAGANALMVNYFVSVSLRDLVDAAKRE